MDNELIVVTDKVQKAIKGGMPVVAVETGGLFRGLPALESMETILESENLMMQNGAAPALIAVLNGKVQVGLSKEDISYLSCLGEELVVITRDTLPMALAAGIDGVVASDAAIMIAGKVGIPVVLIDAFGQLCVAPGSGRAIAAARVIDELEKGDIAVISSGPLTRSDAFSLPEQIMTKGISVIGFNTAHVPVFDSKETGAPLPHITESPMEIAKALSYRRRMSMNGCVLVLNAIGESDALERSSEGENLATHTRIIYANSMLAAWIAFSLSDKSLKISDKNLKEVGQKAEKKSSAPAHAAAKTAKAAPASKPAGNMDFDLWLFSVKGFAQTYDASKLIYSKLPDSAKAQLQEEYQRAMNR